MREDNCIFCKIMAGEIPSRVVYEDEDFKAMLDIDPATKGHTLIIPKNHYSNVLDLGETETARVLTVAKKIATRMMEALDCDGVNLVQNNGEAAGQTVDHFHLHVIPRYENDPDKTICGWSHQSFTDEEFDAIQYELKL